MTVADRVARGVAILDERGPADWRERINLRRLATGGKNGGVLGQLYGSLLAGMIALNLTLLDADENGFARFTQYPGSQALTTTWYHVVCASPHLTI